MTEEWPKPPTRPPNSDYLRIPDTLVPTHYTIELKPDFYDEDPANFSLYGNVTIMMDVHKATKVITVQVRQITIDEDSISVTNENTGQQIQVESTEEFEDLEFYVINLLQEVEEGGLIRVFIQYTAPLKQDDVGLYYSRYYEDGKLR